MKDRIYCSRKCPRRAKKKLDLDLITGILMWVMGCISLGCLVFYPVITIGVLMFMFFLFFALVVIPASIMVIEKH
jgi:hypothetical protein